MFLFFFASRPPPGPTLFPYTTLFRSERRCGRPDERDRRRGRRNGGRSLPLDVGEVASNHRVAHRRRDRQDRKSTRLNSSHTVNSYAVFCLKKKKQKHGTEPCLLSVSL